MQHTFELIGQWSFLGLSGMGSLTLAECLVSADLKDSSLMKMAEGNLVPGSKLGPKLKLMRM